MKKNSIVLKLIVGIIFVLAAVGMYRIATGGADDSPEMASAANFVVLVALVLLGITAALAVVSSLINMFTHPEGLKKTLVGLVIFAVVIAASWFIASDAQVFGSNGEELISTNVAQVSKLTGTGLNVSYVLLTVGGVFFVFDLLKSLIKS